MLIFIKHLTLLTMIYKLYKLYNYGVRGSVFSWFKDYLTNRQQFVSVSNSESKKNSIACDVPQGSVLGPLSFSIYVNDIQHVVPNCAIKLFADDINIFLHNSSLHRLRCGIHYPIILNVLNRLRILNIW